MSDGRSCVHKLHVKRIECRFRIFVNQLLLLFTYLFEKNKQLEIFFSKRSISEEKKKNINFVTILLLVILLELCKVNFWCNSVSMHFSLIFSSCQSGSKWSHKCCQQKQLRIFCILIVLMPMSPTSSVMQSLFSEAASML